MEAKMARWVTVRRVRRCIERTGCAVKRKEKRKEELQLQTPNSRGGKPDESAADADVFLEWPIRCRIHNLGIASAKDWRFRVRQLGFGPVRHGDWHCLENSVLCILR